MIKGDYVLGSDSFTNDMKGFIDDLRNMPDSYVEELQKTTRWSFFKLRCALFDLVNHCFNAIIGRIK